MSVTLPSSPGFASYRPFLVDFGGVQKSALGGASQRVNRLGNRFGLEVQLPPMAAGATAMGWIAALNQGLQDGVICNWPQTGFTVGAPGGLLVNGAAQGGTTLNVDGGNSAYAYFAGQMFNITVGGRYALYQIRSQGALNGAGAAALPILPEIRRSPADNSALLITQPVIEGFLEGDGREWTVDLARTVGLAFTVIEAS